jgi:hypothetical protein
MKKQLFLFLLIGGLFFTTGKVNAQFRSIPGIVTDTFKLKYPNARNVNWSDQITYFQAKFTQDGEGCTARYSSKGEWIQTEKPITEDKMPVAVKDGFTKSKYAGDWKLLTVTVRYLPRDFTNYVLRVGKGEVQRKSLLFAADGQLIKD